MVESVDLLHALEVTLNEADWLGLRAYEERSGVALGFRVLTLPEVGGEGSAIVTFKLHGVTRIAASLRRGLWNDPNASVVPLSLDDLPSAVESFGGQPIYGWEFFDLDEGAWARWRERVSLDVTWAPRQAAHSLTLFQEAGPGEFGERHLDCRLWFDSISANDSDGRELDLDQVARGGRRWWDAMRRGDERTKSTGIVPGGEWPGHWSRT